MFFFVRLLAELGIESADELVNIQEILLESSLVGITRKVLFIELNFLSLKIK